MAKTEATATIICPGVINDKRDTNMRRCCRDAPGYFPILPGTQPPEWEIALPEKAALAYQKLSIKFSDGTIGQPEFDKAVEKLLVNCGVTVPPCPITGVICTLGKPIGTTHPVE